jgi:hypothetical protein
MVGQINSGLALSKCTILDLNNIGTTTQMATTITTRTSNLTVNIQMGPPTTKSLPDLKLESRRSARKPNEYPSCFGQDIRRRRCVASFVCPALYEYCIIPRVVLLHIYSCCIIKGSSGYAWIKPKLAIKALDSGAFSNLF